MKRVKKNVLVSIVVITLMLLFIPIAALAEPVSWSSGTYWAYAHAFASDTYGGTDNLYEDQQENFSPSLPLPITASANVAYSAGQTPGYVHGYANSSADSSSFYTWVDASSYCCDVASADAAASFTGTFTASNPYLQFDYTLSTSYDDWGFSPYTPVYNGWLTVSDLTDNTTLLDMSLIDGTDTISVSLLSGHNIEVEFGIEVFSEPPCCDKSAATQEATLTFNTSVAPEPISSILFATGGTLLAGRRYLRRKKA